MANNYWTKVLDQRLTRRKAMAATAASAGGAALLAACGGGGSSDGGGDESGGLLTRPKDTSSQAVTGGNYQYQGDEPVSLDPSSQNSSITAQVLIMAYSTLLRQEAAPTGEPNKIIGDAAESFEMSPDGLKLTMKIRPNHKFDPRPPTNSRAMTSEDVKFSVDRTIPASPFAANWWKGANPDAPVEAMEYPDSQTVVAKLAYPYLSALDIFALYTNLEIMPKEADGGYDARAEARGSGPFLIERWNPSQNVVSFRNPNWYGKGKPYLDKVTRTFLNDYPAALAQFENGSFWAYEELRPEDVIRVKRDHPELVLTEKVPPPPTSGSNWNMSRQPGSPFHDVRVRRAASMLIDRELMVATLKNIDQLKSEGLPVETYWNSHVLWGYPEWVDPRGKDIGEGGKFFQYDPAEAKKLLAAAGYDAKNAPKISIISSERHDERERAILHAMLAEGFNIEPKVLDYATSWRATCQRSLGQGYDGLCYNPITQLNAQSYIDVIYTPTGKYAYWNESTPTLTDLSNKIKFELNRERQIELIHQFQREAAVLMPNLNRIGEATQYSLHWPWLQNYHVFNGPWSAQLFSDYWYDKSKDPKAKTS